MAIDIQPNGSTRLSVITATVSVVSMNFAQNIAVFIGIVSGMVAVCSGVMAIRYYYYATKKMK